METQKQGESGLYDSYSWSLSNANHYQALSVSNYKSPTTFDYDAGLVGVGENAKATLLKKKSVALQGTTGREALFAVKALQIRSRMYFKNNRLYHIIYVGPNGELETSEVDAFFDSFRFKH